MGEALYNLVLNEGGGVIEDLIVYRMEPERYFVVPNAANAQRVLRMLEEAPSSEPLHLLYHQDWCFLAVQGPESVHVTTPCSRRPPTWRSCSAWRRSTGGGR